MFVFASRMDALKQILYKEMVRRGWFARRPDLVRKRWCAAGLTVLAMGLLATGYLAANEQYGLAILGLAAALGGLVLRLSARFMPSKSLLLFGGLSGYVRRRLA